MRELCNKSTHMIVVGKYYSRRGADFPHMTALDQFARKLDDSAGGAHTVLALGFGRPIVSTGTRWGTFPAVRPPLPATFKLEITMTKYGGDASPQPPSPKPLIGNDPVTATFQDKRPPPTNSLPADPGSAGGMNRDDENQIKRAKKHSAKLLRKIERMPLSERRRRLTKLYTQSWGASSIVADATDFPLDRAHELGGREKPTPTRAWRKAKIDGSTRELAAFSARDRANQLLVRNALAAQADIRPEQFAVKNGGREKAAERIEAALRSGDRFAAELDVKTCFDAYTHEGVKRLLPLPGRTVENIILKDHKIWEAAASKSDLAGRKLNNQETKRQRGRRRNRRHRPFLRSRSRDHNAIARLPLSSMGFPLAFSIIDPPTRINDPPRRVAAQAGLWQGSAVSPLVSEIMIASALAALPEGARVTAYSDNFMVSGGTSGEVRSVCLALHDAFQRHPAGQIELRIGDVMPLAIGLDFVGFNFRVGRGGVRVRPNYKNRARLERKMTGYRDRIMDVAMHTRRADLPTIDKMIQSAHGWAASFRAWPFARAHADRRIREVFNLPPGAGDLRTRLIDYLTA